MSLMLRSLFLRGITVHSNSLLECRGKCDHLGGDTVTEEQQKHHHPKPKEEINNADLHHLQHKDVVGALRDQFGSVAVSSPNSPASWGDLLPELLGEIMRRVETGNDQWPQRQNVVACGGVCKQWKEAVREAVERSSLRQPGQITFTSSLKKPGPRDSPVQCLVRRDKKTETYFLYLALSQSFTDKGKFLLVAKKYRRGMHWEFIISLDVDDLSQGSKSYLGKIRSNFIGTDFMIYDSQPPHSGAKASKRRACRRIGNKQISPQVPAGNFEIGHVTYKFNLFKSKGPRRIVCFLTRPSHEDVLDNSNLNDQKTETSDPAVVALKNKAPRWHEHLQCWCLNFHGRVTVASVKNFQLVAAGENGDSETVLLQFGKVGEDTFTMSYQYPLSPFQAFAICLTSFGTKLACE